MAERVVFATQCERHSGMHLNSDFGSVEIIGEDGRHAAPGEFGRLVATGLHNYAMPLIRYQTSDVSAIAATPCPCGRGFPLLEEVATKDEDIVTTPDGRYLSPSVLNAATHDILGIAESQFIQEDRSLVRFLIVRRNELTEGSLERLRYDLRRLCGPAMQIEIEFVEAIPRTTAGKLRWVISKVPLQF